MRRTAVAALTRQALERWCASPSQGFFFAARMACRDTWKWVRKDRRQWSGWLLLLLTDLHVWRTRVARFTCAVCRVPGQRRVADDVRLK